jgi:hypothetical protein
VAHGPLPMMSVRAKVHLLNLLVLPVGLFGLGLLGMTIHPLIAFLAFPYLILLRRYSLRMRCPNCETPVQWRTHRLFGLRFEGWSWSLLAPKRCENCGYGLTKREGDNKR